MSAPELIGRLGDIDNLVAFFPGIAQEDRDDIKDVLSYAQLRAGHLHDFQGSWHSWVHSYRQHLLTNGFVAQGLVTGDSLVIGRIEDLQQARFSIVNPQVRGRLGEMVKDSFAGLGMIPLAERFFQGGLLSAKTGSFQIMPCERVDTGEIMTLLCSLRLNVDEYAAGSKRLILSFKGGAYRFDPARYAPRRQPVQGYLTGKANTGITPVNLS